MIEPSFLKNGAMDFEEFRRKCIGFARVSIKEGYAEDFAQFCAEVYLTNGFYGYRRLTSQFYDLEFARGGHYTPKNHAKKNAKHLPIHGKTAVGRKLPDMRTVELVLDFQSRYNIGREDGKVQGELWLAFDKAIKQDRAKKDQQRLRDGIENVKRATIGMKTRHIFKEVRARVMKNMKEGQRK